MGKTVSRSREEKEKKYKLQRKERMERMQNKYKHETRKKMHLHKQAHSPSQDKSGGRGEVLAANYDQENGKEKKWKKNLALEGS